MRFFFFFKEHDLSFLSKIKIKEISRTKEIKKLAPLRLCVCKNFHQAETLANAISNCARSLTFYYVVLVLALSSTSIFDGTFSRALSQFSIGSHKRLSLRRYFPVFFARSTIVLTQCRLYAELSIFLSSPVSRYREIRDEAARTQSTRYAFAW